MLRERRVNRTRPSAPRNDKADSSQSAAPARLDRRELEVLMASTQTRPSEGPGSGSPATGVGGAARARIDARTLRQDRWWVAPLTTFIVFSAFVVYATIRAFQGSHYYVEPYLSPFYSPCLGGCVSGASDFGQPFGWWPLSAALIVLIFPLGFRLSCYYYRKAYFPAFWLSPPARAVRGPHKSH